MVGREDEMGLVRVGNRLGMEEKEYRRREEEDGKSISIVYNNNIIVMYSI